MSCDNDAGRDGIEVDVERYILSMIFAYTCREYEKQETAFDYMIGG